MLDVVVSGCELIFMGGCWIATTLEANDTADFGLWRGCCSLIGALSWPAWYPFGKGYTDFGDLPEPLFKPDRATGISSPLTGSPSSRNPKRTDCGL